MLVLSPKSRAKCLKGPVQIIIPFANAIGLWKNVSGTIISYKTNQSAIVAFLIISTEALITDKPADRE